MLMLIPTAMSKIVIIPKKMIVWTQMETPLVWKLLNSTARPLPGS